MLWLDPPKGFSIDRHLSKVRSLKQTFVLYEDKVMSGPLFEDIMTVITEEQNYTDTVVLRNALPSLLPPAGGRIDGKALMRLSMFLLEHDEAIRRGEVIQSWNGSPNIWIAGLVSDICKDHGTHPGASLRYTLQVVVLVGPPAGQIFRSSVSPRYAGYLPMMLGVPRRLSMQAKPFDVIGMYLYGCYGTARKRPLTLFEVHVSSSIKTRNKQLFLRRHQ